MNGGVLIAEGLKFLLMLAFQEAQKAGMSTEEILALYLTEKEKFQKRDPKDIPEVGRG